MTQFFVEGTSGGRLDDDSVHRIGTFDTREEAIACAKRTIDSYLLQQYRPDMAPRDLLARYQKAGQHPTIFQDDDVTMNVSGFIALEYAALRCQDYCGKTDA
jgi:hypothetical protein